MAARNILNNDKGIILFMVLSVILVVVAMANIILMMITSQSRLTHHQVSRIQAYYAAQAGMNYALEQLRLGNWSAGNTYPVNFAADDFRPASINSVSVTITASGNPGCQNSPGNTACVNVTANYAYANP